MSEDADQIQQMREQLAAVSAGDVVAEAAAQLVTFAYLRLGLPAEQNAEYRDLDAARLLIDAFGGLLQATEGRLGAYEPELHQALSSLRLSYAELVRQQQEPESPESRLHRPPSGLWVPGEP